VHKKYRAQWCFTLCIALTAAAAFSSSIVFTGDNSSEAVFLILTTVAVTVGLAQVVQQTIGKSIIRTTEEGKEKMLVRRLSQRDIGRRDATIDKQCNISRCVREDFAD